MRRRTVLNRFLSHIVLVAAFFASGIAFGQTDSAIADGPTRWAKRFT